MYHTKIHINQKALHSCRLTIGVYVFIGPDIFLKRNLLRRQNKCCLSIHATFPALQQC